MLLGVNVLKAEFPADVRYEHGEGKLRAACELLDEASVSPWILLSAGVTYEEFAMQVKITCQVGTSGFQVATPSGRRPCTFPRRGSDGSG